MVTAIIVNYNSHPLTVKAVRSVISNQPQTRVIVVDNSEDALELGLLQKNLPPGVALHKPPQNIGFGRACNLAYADVETDWVLLLNPDAWLFPGCLDRLCAALESDPQLAAVSPNVVWDAAGQWLLPPAQLPTPQAEFVITLGLRQPIVGQLVSHVLRRRALAHLQADRPVRQRMLSGGNMLLRRSAIDAVGGLFDPDYFMYYEDADLCLRLQRQGYWLALVPAACAGHAWCASPDKEQLSVPSRARYFAKHFTHSRLLAWSERLRYHLGGELPVVDLGLCCQPPRIDVPAPLRDGWLAELGLNRLLAPAQYRFGCGEWWTLDTALWNRLGSGDYWLRLSRNGRGKGYLYRWRIVSDDRDAAKAPA